MVVARRLPPDVLILVAGDIDPEVRRIAARRIVLPNLPAHDRRIPTRWCGWRSRNACRLAQLHLLARDPDMRVRFTVAERIDPEALLDFQDDPESVIRELVAARLAQTQEEDEADGPGT